MPETSVIIRAFNEAKHLPSLFEGLRTQRYRDFETIVVDSGSYDLTHDIARHHADRLVILPQHDFTFGHSLNIGIKNSGGRYLAIISAHAAPTDAEWLGHLIAPLRAERIAMVYGRQIGNDHSKLGELVDFERTFGLKYKILEAPDYFANNANSAIRRDLWDRHPFDEGLPGLEDIEWVKFFMENGFQVVYEPRACVFHVHEESWAQVRRRYYRECQAAKWIRVLGRRDIPRMIVREMRSVLGDLRYAVKYGKLDHPWDIFRFRAEKLLGSCSGVISGAAMKNPATRRQLLFDRPYKAVVIRAPGDAALEDVEMPALKPGEVLVRVAFQGVCATDLEVFEGSLGYYRDGLAQYPIVPGHEFSGVVAGWGARVSDLKEGARVVVECIQGCGHCGPCRAGRSIGCDNRSEVGVIRRNGGYSEFVITPRRFVHELPKALDLQRASLCEPTAVVIKGLRRLSSAWGASRYPVNIAVVGAGAIGHLAARILSLRGHHVTVFDRDQKRLRLLDGGHIKTTGRLEDLGRFEALIEATGDPDVLANILHGSAAEATILLLGLPYARREFSFETIVGYDKTVVGSVGSGAEDFDQAIAILPKLDLSAFGQLIVPLADYKTAWQASRERKVLKVLLQVGDTREERGVRGALTGDRR